MANRYVLLAAIIVLCLTSAPTSFAQGDQEKIELTNRDTRATIVPTGTSLMVPFVADPAPGGGDLFDTLCSDPAARGYCQLKENFADPTTAC
jgi:hypothetical protein